MGWNPQWGDILSGVESSMGGILSGVESSMGWDSQWGGILNGVESSIDGILSGVESSTGGILSGVESSMGGILSDIFSFEILNGFWIHRVKVRPTIIYFSFTSKTSTTYYYKDGMIMFFPMQ